MNEIPQTLVEKEKVSSETMSNNTQVFSQEEFRVWKELMLNLAEMIRVYTIRHLNAKEVILVCLVSLRNHDILFARGIGKNFNLYPFTHHFPKHQIPAFFYESQIICRPLVNFNVTLFSKIHQNHFYLPRLQEAIDAEFLKATDYSHSALSLKKLIIANLISEF